MNTPRTEKPAAAKPAFCCIACYLNRGPAACYGPKSGKPQAPVAPADEYVTPGASRSPFNGL